MLKDGIVQPPDSSESLIRRVGPQNKGQHFCSMCGLSPISRYLPWINTLFRWLMASLLPMGFSSLYHFLPENWILANSSSYEADKHNTYFMVLFRDILIRSPLSILIGYRSCHLSAHSRYHACWTQIQICYLLHRQLDHILSSILWRTILSIYEARIYIMFSLASIYMVLVLY